jgi:iron complex outermembrane receptor protein
VVHAAGQTFGLLEGLAVAPGQRWSWKVPMLGMASVCRRAWRGPFLLITLMGLVAGPVYAVDTAANGPGDDQLEEVVVTAQKRSEDLRNVPVSISVLNSQVLTTAHIENFDDIARATPGISLTEGGAPGTSALEIRGISSTSGAGTVGVYLDEVPITVAQNSYYDGSFEPKLFDIDRVEVLRGPQGTLYGASSMGGTIRFIPKAPDLNAFTDEVTIDTSNTKHGSENYAASDVLNAPVIPGVLAVRGGVSLVYDSGYINNYNFFTGALDNRGTNTDRPLTARVALLFQPNENLSVTPSVFIQRDNIGDTSIFYPAVGLWDQNKQIREAGTDNVSISSLVIKSNLGFADFTSVSSYFRRIYDRMTDGTFFNSYIIAHDFLDPAYPQFAAEDDAIIGTIASPVPYDITHKNFTQEIRLSSPDSESSKLSWVVGAYASSYSEHRYDTGQVPGLNADFESIYGFNINQSVIGVPGQNLFGDDYVYLEIIDIHQQQYALFGDVDYKFTDRLKASVGLRLQHAHDSETFTGGYFYDYGNPNPYYTKLKNDAVTPRYSLTYDVSDNSNVYATISKGLRLGGPTGPDPTGPGNPCEADYGTFGITNPPNQYKPDSLWSYELGSKSRLLNNQLSVNGAVYYVDWKQIQQAIVLPTCGYSFTTNVGTAESYGGELEVLFRPISHLTLGLNGSEERAIITSSVNAVTVAPGENVLDVPEWTADLSAELAWPATDRMTAFVRGDYDVTGKSFGTFLKDSPNYVNPEYSVLNMSLGVELGHFKASIYAKNLTDDEKIIQQPTLNTVTGGYTVRPRTIGITLSGAF